MNKTRRHFQDHEKVAILKRHLVDKVPVSDLCDELKLHPNQVYDWLKKFFENGHLAFANGRKPKADDTVRWIATMSFYSVQRGTDRIGLSGLEHGDNRRTDQDQAGAVLLK